MAAADRKLVADFTKIYRLRVERATSARVLADFEAKQPKRDPNLDVPKLGRRLAPFHTQLFAWLDDVKASPLKPRTAKNIHDFDQAKGAVGGGRSGTRRLCGIQIFNRLQCGHAIMVKEDLGPQRNAVAGEADWHGHRARAAFRDGDFPLAKTHIKEREALLASAVGGDDPRLVETRRVRILWAHRLGAGAGPAGETAVNS
ncbi:hypothetical protein JL722_13572 [Aureococcus anophagefferens]|nr:hypothetical protein JL722_13572 [Aureococcus anophagefferens]